MADGAPSAFDDPTLAGTAEAAGAQGNRMLETLALQGFSEEEIAELRQEALSQIKMEFKTPEELATRLPKFVDGCEREYKDLQRRIASLTAAQIAGARMCLAQLKLGHDKLEELKSSFRDIDRSISKLQSVASCQQLRQLHHMRANVGKIITWSEVLAAVNDDDMDGLITNRDVTGFYEKLRQFQAIRADMARSSEAGYVRRFERTFRKVDEFIAKFESLACDILRDAALKMLQISAEVDQLQEEHAEQGLPPWEESHRDGLLLQNAEVTLFQQVLEIVDREAKHPFLFKSGIVEDADVGSEPMSVLHAMAVSEALQKGVEDCFFNDILREVVEPVREVRKACDAMLQLPVFMNAIEEVTVLLHCSTVNVVDVIMIKFHNLVVELLTRFAKPESKVPGKPLVDCLMFIQQYSRTCIDNGPLSPYFTSDCMRPTAAAITRAAIDGVSEIINDTTVKSIAALANIPEVDEHKDSGACKIEVVRNYFFYVFQAVQAAAPSASIEILKSLEASFATNIVAFCEGLAQSVEFQRFQRNLVIKRKRAVASARPPAATTAAAAGKPTPSPVAPDTLAGGGITAQDEWFRMVCCVINSFSDVEQGVQQMYNKCFERIGAESSMYGTEYTSPLEDFRENVLPDLPSVLIDRLVEFVDICAAGPKLEELFDGTVYTKSKPLSDVGEAHPTHAYCHVLRDYLEGARRMISTDEKDTFTLRLISASATSFLNKLVRALWNGKVQLKDFRPKVLQDVRVFLQLWEPFVGDARVVRAELDSAKKSLERGLCDMLLTDFQLSAGEEGATTSLQRFLSEFPDAPEFALEFFIDIREDFSSQQKSAALAALKRVAAPPAGQPPVDPSAPPRQVVSLFGRIDRGLAKKRGWFAGGPATTKVQEKSSAVTRYKLPDPNLVVVEPAASPVLPMTTIRPPAGDAPVTTVSLADLMKQHGK